MDLDYWDPKVRTIRKVDGLGGQPDPQTFPHLETRGTGVARLELRTKAALQVPQDPRSVVTDMMILQDPPAKITTDVNPMETRITTGQGEDHLDRQAHQEADHRTEIYQMMIARMTTQNTMWTR